MKTSKLIQGLQSLSRSEWEKFTLFIHSPYFNQNKRTSKLFDFIAGYYPRFDSGDLTKEKGFACLYPNEKYSDQKIRDEISYLNRLLKQFWADQRYREKLFAEEECLIEALREKGLNFFQREVNQLESRLERYSFRNEDYFRLKMKVGEEKNNYFWNQQKRVKDTAIQEKVDNLDLYYLSVKLRETCEMLNRGRILNMNFRLNMIEEIIQYLENEENDFVNEPGIKVYYLIFNMLTYSSEKKHYLNLVNWLEKNDHLFIPAEAISIYRHAQNYCTRKINAGEDEFLKEAFWLYRRLLENKLAFADGFLPHTTFKNIVTVGLRVGEFDWVENFVNAFKEKVPEKDRENVFHFCLASLFDARNQPHQTIRHLQNVQFTDVHYQISARQLLLKSFFQIEDWQTLDYQIDAMKIFLKRNKDISASTRNNHLNFLKILGPLVRLFEKISVVSGEESMKGYRKIMERLEQVKGVSNRHWLVEKTEQLYAMLDS